MPLSWNEIKSRAIEFSKECEDESSEDAEAKSFWDGFFNVLGLTRRRLAQFEVQVKKYGGNQGFVDLFWPGMLLVEHKSKGRSLDNAYGKNPFNSSAERVELLFGLYKKYSSS